MYKSVLMLQTYDINAVASKYEPLTGKYNVLD